MLIFTIISCLLIAGIIAYRQNTDFSESLPVVTGGLILLMYIMAFFRLLPALGYVSVIVTIGLIYYYKKEKLVAVFNIDNLIIVLLLLLLALSQLPRIAVWWDDVNYWATDAKALYYLGGFPGKYGNVAPEFGDYPPVLSLFKYVFLGIGTQYCEGLAYSAYMCLNYIFVLPLISLIKSNKKYVQTLMRSIGAIALVLLPSVCNIVGFQGSCADVTMGLIYGTLLCTIWEAKESLYFYIKIAIYASVLALTKSVGMEWVFFSFVFFLLFACKKMQTKRWIIAWIIPVITEGSWLFFCLINRRVAKLTSSGVKIATNSSYDASGYIQEKIGYFLKGFVAEPIHTQHSGLIDFSALAFVLFILATIVVLGILKVNEKRITVKLLIYSTITCLLAYGIIFIGHITIFATETQYASSEVMAISMSRYAAPFTLGSTILVINMLLKADKIKYRYLICLVAIILSCDVVAVYQGLWGYRDNLSEDIKAVNDMIDEPARLFLENYADDRELWGKRVLYMRDEHSVHWVHDTYISGQAAPIAVVYAGYATDIHTADDIKRIINESHADFIYVDEVEGDPAQSFSTDFKYATLYRIMDGNLIKYE